MGGQKPRRAEQVALKIGVNIVSKNILFERHLSLFGPPYQRNF